MHWNADGCRSHSCPALYLASNDSKNMPMTAKACPESAEVAQPAVTCARILHGWAAQTLQAARVADGRWLVVCGHKSAAAGPENDAGAWQAARQRRLTWLPPHLCCDSASCAPCQESLVQTVPLLCRDEPAPSLACQGGHCCLQKAGKWVRGSHRWLRARWLRACSCRCRENTGMTC